METPTFIAAEQLAKFLDGLVARDPQAVQKLFLDRSPVNAEMAALPCLKPVVKGEKTTASVLGMLNASDIMGTSVIQALYDEEHALIGFRAVKAK